MESRRVKPSVASFRTLKLAPIITLVKVHWSHDGHFEGQLKDIELLNEALDAVAVQALYSGEILENPIDVDTSNNQPLKQSPLQLEVENMDRSGSAQQVSQSFASGGQYVRTGTTTNTITPMKMSMYPVAAAMMTMMMMTGTGQQGQSTQMKKQLRGCNLALPVCFRVKLEPTILP